MIPPSHIPIIVSIMYSYIQLDNITLIQDLIQSNLGPLLNANDHISCSHMHTNLVECSVYAPWKASCMCCKQLKDIFTSEVVSTLVAAKVRVEIDCELLARYHKCHI